MFIIPQENVGINTQVPGSLLDVSGNVIVSGNLSVGGLIQANALKGDGSGITNINASQINQGTVHNSLITGPYTNITGVGTITSGTWQGNPIEDQYLVDQLTINGGSIEGNNTISGNLTLVGPTTISGNYDLQLSSPKWTISKDGDLSLRSVSLNNTVLISGNVIETNSLNGLQIKPKIAQDFTFHQQDLLVLIRYLLQQTLMLTVLNWDFRQLLLLESFDSTMISLKATDKVNGFNWITMPNLIHMHFMLKVIKLKI